MVSNELEMYNQLLPNIFMRITIVDKCWVWTGPSQLGYPRHSATLDGKRIRVRVHRLMYKVFRKSIPTGKIIRQTCDNKLCVRPTHLEVSTQSHNMVTYQARSRYSLGRKLTLEQLEDIRARHASGNMTGRRLADRHSVSASTVSRAINNKTYAQSAQSSASVITLDDMLSVDFTNNDKRYDDAY